MVKAVNVLWSLTVKHMSFFILMTCLDFLVAGPLIVTCSCLFQYSLVIDTDVFSFNFTFHLQCIAMTFKTKFLAAQCSLHRSCKTRYVEVFSVHNLVEKNVDRIKR